MASSSPDSEEVGLAMVDDQLTLCVGSAAERQIGWAGFVFSFVPQLMVVNVYPGDTNWAFTKTDDSGELGEGSGSGDWVTGPATPPQGVGSFNLLVPTGSDGARLATSLHNGMALSELTHLSYSTYASDIGDTDQLPYFSIWVDYLGPEGGEEGLGRIDFEPYYSTVAAGNGGSQSAVGMETWQSWDLMTGLFYSGDPGGGFFTLAELLGDWPDASISGLRGGGLRVASGYASGTDSFDTNFDAIRVNNTIYSFDPEEE